MLVDLDAAQEEIGALNPLLIDAYEAAAATWEELVTEHPRFGEPLRPRSRANVLHDYLCPELERRVWGVPNVDVDDSLGFFALKIGTTILLRHKFVGHGAPSNVRTTQQKRLARQEFDENAMLALSGDPAFTPPTLLTCGYTLDGFSISRLEIRMDCKGKKPWSYDIYGGDAVAEPLIIPGMADDTKPALVKSSRKTANKDERAAGA